MPLISTIKWEIQTGATNTDLIQNIELPMFCRKISMCSSNLNKLHQFIKLSHYFLLFDDDKQLL